MTMAGRMKRPSILLTGLGAIACVTTALQADDFTLKDGRKFTGQLVNKNGDVLVVELSPGNMLLINQQELKVHPQNAKGEAAYAEALKTASETIESHLNMASVAHKNQLVDHKKAHYERIIELDPDHATARDALGFTKNRLDGSWISRDEQMREGRGKIAVGHRYVFPELSIKQQAEAKFEIERGQLVGEIKRALGNLSNPRNSAKAQATLEGLNGPVASSAIAFLLYPKSALNRGSASPAHKALFIPILERLGDATALQTLMTMCLDSDRSNEQVAVRQQALGVLKRLAPEAAFNRFMSALATNDNPTINLAAELLQELGDERATLPLIERLITIKRDVSGGSKATNAGMSNGNAGFSSGDPLIVRNINVENPGVLGALVSITGQNFSYDKGAWLNWYEQNYVAYQGDLRRDP